MSRECGSSPVTVDYDTVDGSALAGTDYSWQNGTLSFAPGETNKTVLIPVVHVAGADKHFYFQLNNPQNGAGLGDAHSAGITIQNGGSIALAGTNIICNSADAAATINILRADGSAPTIVDYTTVDGTARAGIDYNNKSGTLFFGSGETNKMILIPLIHTTGSDKLFRFTLSNPQNLSTLGPTISADITIQNPSPLQSILNQGGTVRFSSNTSFTLSSPLILSEMITLDANGHDVVFDGGNISQIFNIVSNANVTLSGLRLTGGNNTNGGALYNDHGTVLITNCVFSNNIALGADAVLGMGLPGGGAEGGAIYNAGVMTLVASVFEDNMSQGGAGNDHGNIGYNGYIETAGGEAEGGAIFNAESLSISNCFFIFNTVQGGRGGDNGVEPSAGTGRGGSGQGGAIATMTPVNLVTSSFTSNSATGGQNGSSIFGNKATNATGGGGAIAGFQNGSILAAQCLFNANIAMGGNSPTNINNDGQASFGGAIYALTNAILVDSMFSNNCACGSDGGSRPADYLSFFFAQSPGGIGGSAYGGATFAASLLAITNCSFVGNSALAGKGGTGAVGGSYFNSGSTYPGESGGTGGAGTGGAIAAYGLSNIKDSAFLSNTAQGAYGGKGGNGITGIRGPASNGGNGANGGGAYGGGIFISNAITMVNCTLADNQAIAGNGGNGGLGGSFNPFYPSLPNGADGSAGISLGGAMNFMEGPSDLSFLTVASNAVHAGLSGHATLPSTNSAASGGGLFVNNSEVSLRNSLLVSNLTENYFGPLSDGGGNFSTDANGTFTQPNSFNNTDPKLGPLGDYGGCTWTFSLLPGSPAIDAAGTTDCPPFDQRGFPRPVGAACDSGAFETQ